MNKYNYHLILGDRGCSYNSKTNSFKLELLNSLSEDQKNNITNINILDIATKNIRHKFNTITFETNCYHHELFVVINVFNYFICFDITIYKPINNKSTISSSIQQISEESLPNFKDLNRKTFLKCRKR